MEARSSGADDRRAARNVSRRLDRCLIMMPQLKVGSDPLFTPQVRMVISLSEMRAAFDSARAVAARSL
jgi:hypothetical protein